MSFARLGNHPESLLLAALCVVTLGVVVLLYRPRAHDAGLRGRLWRVALFALILTAAVAVPVLGPVALAPVAALAAACGSGSLQRAHCPSGRVRPLPQSLCLLAL